MRRYTSTVLTIRISDEIAADIERISEEERLDVDIVTRRLLTKAVKNHRLERALEAYDDGAFSLEQLSEETDLPLRQVLSELRERGVHFNYSANSLREDAEG